ncbi:MAG: mechanosensitive ion channel family protein [Synergistaceae bacterium]|nr:mechanosensitive ion channel family protein [Synergistaceae bacterium]
MPILSLYQKEFLVIKLKMILEIVIKNMATILFIVFILFLWFLIDRMIPRVITHIFRVASTRARHTLDGDNEIRREWFTYRMSTLRQLITQLLRAVLATVMGFTILSAVGINVRPILAGIGIAGLGISLAAQNLIRDFINGILIIVEDQYNVNDWVQIGSYQGTVEHFTLRLTRLRSLEGNLIIIPNSTIQDVVNYTKDWAYAAIYVTIPYEADYLAAKKIIIELADETVKSGDPLIFPDPVFNGIVDYTLNGVKFRCFIKTAPGYQWKVGYKFREELRARYDKAGITFAYPAVNNHLGPAEDPAFFERMSKIWTEQNSPSEAGSGTK